MRRLVSLIVVAVPLVAGGVVISRASGTVSLAFAFHSALVDQGPAPTLLPGATTSYTIRFRNSGLVPWERGGASQVTLAVSGDSTEFADAHIGVGWLSATRVATTEERSVAPGATGTFTFSVRAPSTPGVTRIPLRLVVDGLTWLEDDHVVVQLTSDLGFHDQLIDQSRHPTLKVGELSAPLTVRIRNTGARTWVRGAASQVNLGVAGDAPTGVLAAGWPTADRVAIQTEPSVAPGGIATFTFRVRAPMTTGMYVLRLRPVADGVTWLEDDGIVSLVTVTAGPGAQPALTARAAATPTFTTSGSVRPATVAMGSPVTIAASFQSAVASTAIVGVEVSAPGGAVLVQQKWFEAQAFGAGEQRTFPVDWQVPPNAAAGVYGVNLRVFGPDWKTVYSSADSATTFTVVATPAPQAAAATSQPPAPSQPQAPGGAPTNPTASPSAPSAPVVPGATATPAPAATAAPSAPPTTAPATTAPATTAPAAPAPSFTATAVVGQSSVAAGGSVDITDMVTSATTANTLVDVEVWAPGGTVAIYQVWFDAQSFAAGQQRTYPVRWQIPAGTAPGTYTVKLGVFAPQWKALYSWTETAATFTITAAVPTATPSPTAPPSSSPTAPPAPTATPTPMPTAPTATPTPMPTATAVPSGAPSFTATASVPTTSLVAGTTVSVTATFTSATAANTLVNLSIYPPTGTVMANQQWFDNQSFAAGQQRTYTVSWLVPANAAPGIYTVSLGVFSPQWKALYYWQDKLASFIVTSPAPAPAPSFSGVHVQGNRLVNSLGQTVQLHGVNRSGSEFMCLGGGVFDGPADAASVAAMKTWHVNAVRIAMNEDCWLAINGTTPAYSGAFYQQALKDYVNLLNQNGIYAILELHWTAPGATKATGQQPMPDMDHTPTFWSQVATAFKGNDAVIFEPFNEPYPDGGTQNSTAGWKCWRDGGTCNGIAFQVAGMQTLVTSIRATGATNVIALGGLRWANFLDQWLAYKPNDTLNNLAAAWHTYDFTDCNTVACYDGRIAPVAAQVPIITTEIGSNSCNAPFMNTLMGWLDAHGTSYLAWTWDVWGLRVGGDPNSCPSYALITDYNGTPTTYGQIYKSHLALFP